MKNNAFHKMFICSEFNQLHLPSIRRPLFIMDKWEAGPNLINGIEKHKTAKPRTLFPLREMVHAEKTDINASIMLKYLSAITCTE